MTVKMVYYSQMKTKTLLFVLFLSSNVLADDTAQSILRWSEPVRPIGQIWTEIFPKPNSQNGSISEQDSLFNVWASDRVIWCIWTTCYGGTQPWDERIEKSTTSLQAQSPTQVQPISYQAPASWLITKPKVQVEEIQPWYSIPLPVPPPRPKVQNIIQQVNPVAQVQNMQQLPQPHIQQRWQMPQQMQAWQSQQVAMKAPATQNSSIIWDAVRGVGNAIWSFVDWFIGLFNWWSSSNTTTANNRQVNTPRQVATMPAQTVNKPFKNPDLPNNQPSNMQTPTNIPWETQQVAEGPLLWQIWTWEYRWWGQQEATTSSDWGSWWDSVTSWFSSDSETPWAPLGQVWTEYYPSTSDTTPAWGED